MKTKTNIKAGAGGKEPGIVPKPPMPGIRG